MIEINLPSISNIRDFGDTPTGDGRRIIRNRLIRSAKLTKAERQDLEYLKKEHELDTVIDLRTFSEIEEAPDICGDLNYLHMPIIETFKDGVTHEKKETRRFPDMTEIYIDIVSEPNHVRNIRKILKTIMNRGSEEGAVLWHCSEGKDRCGLISAMVLKILGVNEDIIIQDYLETNKINLPKAEALYKKILSSAGEEFARGVYQAYIADERYLKAAFEKMGDNFIENVLQLDQKAVEEFRNRLLI